LRENKFGRVDQKISAEHHSGIEGAHVAVHFDRAFSVNTDESLEELVSWDSNFVESHPAVVFAMVAELWSHVTCLYSWHMLVSVSIPYLQ
jgi:hypothetical protein